MGLLKSEFERAENPMDLIEMVAASNDWSFERTNQDEIAITAEGQWTIYHLSISWIEEVEALHLACAFEFKVTQKREWEVLRLMSLVNEQLLIGHFDMWEQESTIMFRQTLLLSGGAEPTGAQVETLMASALEACERYYQAFQFVLWSGMEARKAMELSHFETVGTA